MQQLGGDLQMLLPHGFRFHPTDEELVKYYLLRKCAAQPLSAPIVAEIDLYKYDPWELPEMARYGVKEWYFFSPRDRKYPNGCRPNRAAGTGYWKATGADKPVGSPKPMAIKKALVFYAGKPPQGVKTNWIMHEYRLADVDRSVLKKNNSLRLDDWVLCRIYNKKGIIEKSPVSSDRRQTGSKKPRNSRLVQISHPKLEDDSWLGVSEVVDQPVPRGFANLLCFNGSGSGSGSALDSSPPQPPPVDTSCSAELTCEVDSRLSWSADAWDGGFGLDFGTSSVNCPPLSPAFLDSMYHDVFTYLEKPF